MMKYFRNDYETPGCEVIWTGFPEDILGGPSAGEPGAPGANDDIVDDGDLD